MHAPWLCKQPHSHTNNALSQYALQSCNVGTHGAGCTTICHRAQARAARSWEFNTSVMLVSIGTAACVLVSCFLFKSYVYSMPPLDVPASGLLRCRLLRGGAGGSRCLWQSSSMCLPGRVLGPLFSHCLHDLHHHCLTGLLLSFFVLYMDG